MTIKEISALFAVATFFILLIVVTVAESATLKGSAVDTNGINWFLLEHEGKQIVCTPVEKAPGTPVLCYDSNRVQYTCVKRSQIDGFISDCKQEDWF